MERQRTVLVGVTGCIAAYKACEIVRGLQKAGVRAKVVMTEHATEFVGPTTFRALTHEPVAVGLFDDPSDPIHHISLAQEADVFLIAPCTANVMAKIAHGIADDLLTTTALATTSPLVIAPAMNVHMYEAAATQENMRTLARRGVRFVEAGEGYLACGDVGRGRLADPDEIVAFVLDVLGEGPCEEAQSDAGDTPGRDLEGLRVLVTAGPTVEAIDPVRFISNRSSGKSGYAIARAAARRGAEVTLVSGPVALADPDGVRVVRVESAREMLSSAQEAFAQADIAVFTAAVADLRPANPADRKLKKGRDDAALSRIELAENPDILAALAASKASGQVVVGYAAETDDVIGNAKAKLARKNADMIVANRVGGGRAFGTDANTVSFVVAGEGPNDPTVTDLPEQSKDALGDAVLSKALAILNEKRAGGASGERQE